MKKVKIDKTIFTASITSLPLLLVFIAMAFSLARALKKDHLEGSNKLKSENDDYKFDKG